MKWPLGMVTLAYAAGLLLADWFSLPLLPLFVIAFGLGLLALAWRRAQRWLLWPLILLAGMVNLTWRTAIISPHDLRTLLGDRTEAAAVRGQLTETPYHRVYEHNDKPSWRTLAQVEVDSIKVGGTDWTPATGRITVSTPGMLPPGFWGGQPVEISGIVRPPQPPVAPGMFDYGAFLRRLGIYYQLQAESTNDWQRLAQAPPPLADRFRAWAQATLALGLAEEDEPLQLLWAMTLGWKTALTGEVSEPFMRSGTMHVFAISGLHIALIAWILVSLLGVLKVPRGWCGLIVIPLIWAYTGVTGFQASAIRSTIMMTIIIAGWALKRPSNLLNSLAAAAFIILLWDPQQLFQAGFQLSFFVVLSLALFTPVLDKVRQRLLQPDPLLPDQLRPRWQKWLRKPAHWVTAGLVTSLAAWLGSMPLIAWYFHLFTPVTLLANLVVVPLSSAALACNLASLVVGGWFPACAELFNHSAWLFMCSMIRISELAAQAPGGVFFVAPPSWLTFLLYYGLLVSAMAGWLAKPRVRWWVAGCLGALALVWVTQWQLARLPARLTVLPLNGGHAAFLEGGGISGEWLVDCGNESSAQFVTRPFLQAQGVNRLAHVLFTHGDTQHVGGAPLVARYFSVREVCFSPVRFRSVPYRRVQEHFGQPPDRTRLVQRGDHLGPWTILHPEPADRFPQADDNALVLRGEIQGTRVLLLSDLGKPGQNALVQRTPDLRADIVIAGLPAQTEPLADALLDAIQPRLIIIADSTYPATGRASPPLRERVGHRQIPVLYTRETGAVTLAFRRGGWTVKTMREPPPPPDPSHLSAASVDE